MEIREIQVGNAVIKGLALKLQKKNLVMLIGSRGYIMCGYLDMSTADKFADTAIKITGVVTIDDALIANAVEVSRNAVELGIRPGQSVKKILPIIA